MADALQHGSISGSASVRQNISGEITIGGKIMKELRFLPYSEFPEIGREETLYIDTDNNAMYYYDGSSYVSLSGGGGGGTDNYNALSNKPSVNSITLIGNKTSSELGLQELISDLSTIRSGAALGTTAVQPETLETALSDKQDVINDLDDIRAGAELGATAVQPSDMESALADKQDTISDLATIRSGATAGATAVQPDDMEEALSEKQDTISDLQTIRSGAALGATAVQPSDMETALSGKQDTISDLQTIRSGAALGATAVQPADMETALADKQDVIDDLNDIRTGAALGATSVQPADMETALADKQDVISDLDSIRSGATAGNTALQPEDIDTLPTDGSSNPVSSGGTYNFVNSSIATNTAYFIGTFTSVAELEAYTGTVTNNDYAFVTSTDSAGNTLYNRYKYNAATQTWSFEYAVNNTAFTAAQWAAIQSGMTSADKTKIDGIEQGATKTVIDAAPTSGSSNAVSSGGVHTALSGKQDTISDLSDIRSGASAGATAVQPSALTDYQTKLSGTNKLDPAYIEYDATHRAVSDTEKSTWSGKQDTISDLPAIRSGAAAGATALQQSDVTSTYSASGTAPVNGTAVNAAIETLDVSSVGGSGKYISAISETNGKISATPTNFDTALSSSSTNNNTPTTKAVYDDQQRQEVEIGVVANAGAKNLNPYQTYTTASAATVLDKGTIDLPAGTYILSYKVTATTGNCAFRLLKNDVSLWNKTIANGTGTITETFTIAEAANQFTIYTDVSNTISDIMIRPSSITDLTFVPYAKTNVELTAENTSQQSEINYVVNTGAKNLLVDQASTGITTGITYTHNSDGTITASGTASASGWHILSQNNTLKKGRYKLSGGYSGAATCIISPTLSLSDAIAISSGDEIEFELSTDTQGLYYALRTQSGTTLNNAVFKPMLRLASITDDTFVPYAFSNPVITPALIQQVDNGAKSIFPIGVQSKDYSSTLSMTVDNEGVITVNGTRNDSTGGILYQDLVTNKTRYQDTRYTLPVGTYGCKGGGTESIRLQVYCHDGTNATQLFNSSYDGTFTYSQTQKQSQPYITFRLAIQPGNVSLNNHKVYPMICTAADWAVSQKFGPYSLPNPILTPALIEQVDGGAKNLFDISTLKSSGALAGGSYTNNGVTYTLNSDGTISLSGTATSPNSTCSFVLFNSNSPYLSKFAGKELSGGLSNKVYLAIEMSTSPYTSLAASRGGASTIAAPDSTKQYLFYIRVMRGENVDGKIISPMICTAADYAVSPAFVPHARTNVELTAKEQQNENNILLNTKYGGGRNVGNFAYYGLNHDQSIAAGTITYTESNGVFTFTGAADSSKNYACYLLKKQIIKAGNYVVSGISGGSTSTYWFRIGTGISDTFKMNVTDSGTTLTLDSDTKITLQLVVKSGVSLSNKVFSPMIITAADWANSHDFQQYGESNAQLSSIVQVDIDNMTEFKFAKLDELSSSVHFKYGFLIGGGGASTPNKVMLWHIFVNTSNSVYFTKIIGDDTMTLTGSISDGVLTITSSATIYGGLRLIWLG